MNNAPPDTPPQGNEPTAASLEELKLKVASATIKYCQQVLVEAYEDAGISGLCQEGRWEFALQALKAIDPKKIDLK